MLDRLKQGCSPGSWGIWVNSAVPGVVIMLRDASKQSHQLPLYWLRLADNSRQNQQTLDKVRFLLTPGGVWKFAWGPKFNFIPEVDIGRGGIMLWGTTRDVLTSFSK